MRCTHDAEHSAVNDLPAAIAESGVLASISLGASACSILGDFTISILRCFLRNRWRRGISGSGAIAIAKARLAALFRTAVVGRTSAVVVLGATITEMAAFASESNVGTAEAVSTDFECVDGWESRQSVDETTHVGIRY